MDLFDRQRQAQQQMPMQAPMQLPMQGAAPMGQTPMAGFNPFANISKANGGPGIFPIMDVLGTGLQQMDRGAPVNVAPVVDRYQAQKKAEEQKEQMKSAVQAMREQMSPVQWATFKKMPEPLQMQLIMQMVQQQFAPPKVPDPVKGVEVNGNLVNPITGEVIYQGGQKPEMKWIDGIGMVDMNNPPPELAAGTYQPPAGGDASEAEQEIARLEAIGIPRDVAIRIKEGVYKAVPNPVTGETLVIDLSTGATVYEVKSPSSIDTQAATPEERPSLTYGGVPPMNAEEAFGFEGAAKNAANKISDTLGLGEVFPNTARHIRDFAAWEERLLVSMAQAYPRMPASALMERLRSLAPQAGSILEGPEAAKGELNALRTQFENDLWVVEQSLIRPMKPAEKEVLEKEKLALQQSIALTNEALSRFGGGDSDIDSIVDRWAD